MFGGANRLVLVVIMLRVGAAITVLSAISFGVYISFYGSVVTGLMWIVSAVVGGWVANIFLRLVILLAGTQGAPSAHR